MGASNDTAAATGPSGLRGNLEVVGKKGPTREAPARWEGTMRRQAQNPISSSGSVPASACAAAAWLAMSGRS